MDPIRILLAVEPAMFSELLRTRFEREQDLQVRCEAFDPIELLLDVARTKVDVVVMSVPETEVPPPICTQLLEEFPDLIVIGLCAETNRAVAYRNSISTAPMLEATFGNLVATIRKSA